MTLAAQGSGREDFDFLRGFWAVRNRRLQDPLDPASRDWREFTTEVENRPLGGLGNVDIYRSSEFPGSSHFEAIALRLFHSEDKIWRIWWSSTSTAGQLDTPVVGKFDGPHGVFLCDDVLAGRTVKVKYEWLVESERPRWKQSFSFDEGDSWHENWHMDWWPRPAAPGS